MRQTLLRVHVTYLLIIAFVLVMAGGYAWLTSPLGGSGGTLPGNYEVIATQRPHSLHSVTLDVFADFTCPHCQHFYPEEAKLQQRYGDRLVIRHHYVANNWNNQNAGLRLYLVAQKAGKGNEVADALMRAGLQEGNDKQMLAATSRVAQKFGLSDQFKASLASNAVTAEIGNLNRSAIAMSISFTPALVIDGDLLTRGEPQNVITMINGLLTAGPTQKPASVASAASPSAEKKSPANDGVI